MIYVITPPHASIVTLMDSSAPIKDAALNIELKNFLNSNEHMVQHLKSREAYNTTKPMKGCKLSDYNLGHPAVQLL